MQLLAGFLLGVLVSALVGGVIAAWAWRKSRQLERRAAESERLAELGLLTGGLAHEIKNPLSTVQLNLQLLREDVEHRLREAGSEAESQQLGRMARRIGGLTNETLRLREILDDFLRYAGRLEVEAQETNLVQLSEELIDFLAPQAHLARVRLELSDDAGGGPVLAQVDPKLIKQALLNLLINAIQHTPEGGRVTLRILSDRTPRGRREARLEVSDTGRGIAQQEQSRVFEPYFTRRKGGTGLGLATTRRIVNAHAGEISLESTPGSGTRFVISLPAATAPVEAPRPAAGVAPVPPAAA